MGSLDDVCHTESLTTLMDAEETLRCVLTGEDPEIVGEFIEFVEFKESQPSSNEVVRERVKAIVEWGREGVRNYFQEFCLRREELGIAQLLWRVKNGEPLSFLESVDFYADDDTPGDQWIISPWQPRDDDDGREGGPAITV